MKTTIRTVATGAWWKAIGLLGLAALVALAAGADDKPKPALKTESFDRDPGWEGFNNRIELKKVPTVTQDYGYSATKFAAKEKGELGGRVQRSTTPSYYAEKIAPKTLNDRLTASGTFALTATGGNSGVFFGWFNADQPGGSGRPIGSFGFDFDGEKSGGRLAVRLINGNNKSCGTFVTPFIPGKFRPTPIKNDGTRYAWTLDYDPDGNGGAGRFQVTVKSDSDKPEEFEGKTFTVDLPAGFKKEGATFDRFGMMNLMKSGGPMTLYFGDLKRDGKALDFSTDPGWVGSGNRAKFEDREQAGAHDFGFSEKTSFAGGKPGEIGGSFWRTEKNWGYYADKVGPLTFDDRLEASGRVVLKVGAPDSDMFFGWFDAAAKDKDKPPAEVGPFLGVHVGGPTRVGHYFLPTYTTAKGTKRKVDKGPILLPGKTYEWKLVYDPTANGGKGSVQVTLGEETVTLALKEGDKAQGGRFGRFGLCTAYSGGQLVKIYFDDLKYTAAPAK